MNISQADYFFYEWLIIEKKMSEDALASLSPEEFKKLHDEWKAWFYKQ